MAMAVFGRVDILARDILPCQITVLDRKGRCAAVGVNLTGVLPLPDGLLAVHDLSWAAVAVVVAHPGRQVWSA
ncbi:hypothetical protein [Paracoccus sp. pheM1]|uniref:hypothetical protein n=1 Tax=Paracoccus sp. pheM1 TaxID=2831675 RepID=UPI001BDB7BC6|nr:hypothetical protein [Paracoccus sp. pheM1]MBT0782985.1 hypothetical protein [Paracoccus sp. pheM1]